MAELSREALMRLALLGAKARLAELREEEAAIRRAFPELFRGGRATAATQKAGARRGMSAAGRRAVSERMKKYWAERRKARNSK